LTFRYELVWHYRRQNRISGVWIIIVLCGFIWHRWTHVKHFK